MDGMNNLKAPDAMSDAVFQQVVNQQITRQRDADLSVRHKIDWEAQHRMVWIEAPLALQTAIRSHQRAIQTQQERLEDVAKGLYTAALEALKRRYHERGDITRVEYDQRQKELYSDWQNRRVDLAKRYIYTFADARLKSVQEQSYAAARAASDAVWAREGASIIESYAMPTPPSWSRESEPEEGPADKKPTRRRSAAAR
jgi:hypothetical protein